MATPLFSTGVVTATPRVMAATTLEHLDTCLKRHVTGDWGLVCEDDKRENDESLQDGRRILSAYALDPDNPDPDKKLWVITEADRSYTTFLLPEEY